ncbi:acetylxylan esterase [uncultured Victivallis sp.]|uniref:acetylxylan esterase n=1 Tax=uncultured Victivallis sp. TaxID=354118 RepID=UPI0025DFAB49|nr:acetylxylan esterase [uncultured Victivallis sp.]
MLLRSAAALLCAWIAAAPTGAAAELAVDPLPASGVCRAGEEAQFIVRYEAGTGPRTIRCSIIGGAAPAVVNREVSAASGKFALTHRLEVPGGIVCVAESEKSGKAAGGVLFSPEKIRPADPVPDDFDRFWAENLAALDQVNPAAVRREPTAHQPQGVRVWDVEIPCVGNAPVRGHLAIPEGARPGSLPVEVSFHGAGVVSARMPWEAKRLNRILFDVNAHGIPNGRDAEFYREYGRKQLHGYQHWFVNDRDRIYFKNMVLRACQALRFVRTLPEWDGRNLIVSGGSQGGFQALAAAGLDPRVSCVVAYVPAVCDVNGFRNGRAPSWPRFQEAGEYDPVRGGRAARYVDTANFASRIRNAACFVSAGGRDLTSPAVSVYAAFNVIPSENKTIVLRPEGGHEIPGDLKAEGERFIRSRLKPVGTGGK